MPERELPGVLPAFLAGEPPGLVAAIEGGTPLFTYSRRDWLHRALSEVGEAFGGSCLMDFFSLGSNILATDSEEPGFLVTALMPSALPAAIATLDEWLESIAAEPGRLAARMGVVADDLRIALVSWAEDEGALEDGDGLPYLFWFLRCLRTELVGAQSSGQPVLHARYVF